MFTRAWESWHRSKTIAILAAAALAVGIGSATSIYTVVNAVMLAPLPYKDGDRFVALFGAELNDPEHYASLSYKDAETYQERTRAFDAFGWFRDSGKNLMFAGEPYHVKGVSVTTPLVHQLGVNPAIGRWFNTLDGVVISNGLWRRLGGDPSIAGKSLTLDGRPYTITGVMAESFQLPAAGLTDAGQRVDVWLPLDPREGATSGAAYFAYARRRPHVSFAQADADAKRVAAQIAAESPSDHRGYTARLFDLRESVIKDVRPTLLLVFAAAGLLFLITCANAAGLLLARAVARTRETAVRVAIGAERRQLAAQYLAESLPISLAGAVGGILLSVLLTPAVISMAEDYLPRAEEIGVDWKVVLFAVSMAIVASALSSLAPLWQAVQIAPADVLAEGSRASRSWKSGRISQALVVGEVALAFALLAASALLLVHLQSLFSQSPGFDPDRLVTFVLSLPGDVARTDSTRIAIQRRVLDSLKAIPGVDDVALASQVPLDGCCMGTALYPDGHPVDPRVPQRTSLMAVSPSYFRTMRIPLRRGRLLTEFDASQDSPRVVIDRATAERYWGTADPLGAFARFSTPTGTRFQVVGIVDNVKNDGLTNPTVPTVYVSGALLAIESMHIIVRSPRPLASLMPDVRRAIRGIDREQPIDEVDTMQAIVRDSVTLERAASVLTAFFAAAALLMATLGVYGVLSYLVRQRTVEIGTRMALGATRVDVLSLVVGSGMRMAAYGVVIGAAGAVAAAAYLGRAFDVSARVPQPFVYAVSIVVLVALAAAAVPGWRAAALSPMSAIRDAAIE